MVTRAGAGAEDVVQQSTSGGRSWNLTLNLLPIWGYFSLQLLIRKDHV